MGMVSKKAMSAYNKGLIASAALLLVMSLQCFAQKPIKTTLCAIIRNPQRFHRVLVEFQSKYDVGFENPILEDAECENGIVASFTGKLQLEEKLKNVCKDKPGTVGTLNAAIWLGVFRYHPNAVSTWTLDVRQVRVLTFLMSCESPLGVVSLFINGTDQLSQMNRRGGPRFNCQSLRPPLGRQSD